MFEYDQARLREIAQAALDFAREFGATGAAVDVSENSGLSVNVRKGRIETIEQNRDKGLGVTVYSGQRMGHASSTDFSAAALRETVNAAWQIARFTAEDPCAGLPDPDTLATSQPDLKVFHEWPITVDDAVDIARRAERAAFDTSPAIAANSLSMWLADWQQAYTLVRMPGLKLLRDPYTTKGEVMFYAYQRVGGLVTNSEAIKAVKFAAA